MDAEASCSPLSFGLLILFSLCWIILVGILLPRLLGRSLAFVANRFFHDASHVSIPSLYIYPLSGRIVAHSVRYTIPNGTFSVEELVLQCRWWRKVQDVQFRQLLTVDDPHTLDPVAAEQQEMEQENAAFFIRRFWYRLRRWWHRTAVTTDPNNSVEPRPLISLICVGLRARIVNDQKNYAHVNKVLTLARATARRSAQHDGAVSAELEAPLSNELDSSHASAMSADVQNSESSSSTYSSVASVDGKPWQQRMLEVVSLRISDGAFYFCDMGESPLIRLTVNSAKLRYRYGAAACSADECRKRIRVRVSGLKLSVSSKDAVERIVRKPIESSSNSRQSCADSENGNEVEESNTDRIIRRIMSLGHKGFSIPQAKAESLNNLISKRRNHALRRAQSVLPRLTTIHSGRGRLRRARIPQVLPCSEVLNATTAVIDYVFDEPGFERASKDTVNDVNSINNRQEGSSDTYEKLPAPVCRISVLLRGCSFSYDFQAIADIERVLERLQPVFYDLRSLARKVRSGEAKRSADGIQIEIEATPKSPKKRKENSNAITAPVISLPFIPGQSTWRALLAMNVRNWPDKNEKHRDQKKDEKRLPHSQLSVLASRIRFRTEVPYRAGVAQKTVLSLKDVAVNAEGIVEMPLGTSSAISVTRVIHYPVCWNDEHVVTSDVQISDAEFWCLPDTFRILNDINTTVQALSRKPESVRFFIPFRETTRIVAAQGYRIILSCCHDNAWRDIHAGEGDQYGRMIVCGEEGELVLSPNAATEFVTDSAMSSWSLSLPNAVGKLDFSLPAYLSAEKGEERVTSELELAEVARNVPQKNRASSLAHFVKTWETFAGHSHHSSAPTRRNAARHFGIEFLRAGETCKLSGKGVTHKRRIFLGTEAHTFLDSVNRGDVHIKVSSLQLDLNPHHVTHILNLIRNHAGPGIHTISTTEGSQLRQQRLSTARRILMEGRFPTATECMIIGLPAGISLSSLEDRTALDDILCVVFQIDQVLVRLHDQPHALSPFLVDTHDTCSLECRKLEGSLSSNRLGLEVSCSPDNNKNFVFVREGYREFKEGVVEKTQPRHEEKVVPPTATIADLLITKRSWADQEWGSYHSELKIKIGGVSGCVTDTSVGRIAHFAWQLVPDALHEDSEAVAAMLSVENIEVQLSKLDLLVLSPSSAFFADRSGQMNKLIPSEGFVRGRRLSPSVNIPKLLSSVSQIRLPVGLRFVMSNLASEDLATRSRIFISDITVDVLKPWGSKLIPWVDDMTMRAQVAHATLLRHGRTADGFADVRFLRRVAGTRDITVDLSYDRRPLLWSTRITTQQRVHINRLRSQTVQDILPWLSVDREGRKEKWNSLFTRHTLNSSWWDFLDGAYKASKVKKYVDEKSRAPHHLDYFSVSVLTSAVIFISPESLEIVIDRLIRSKEAISAYSGNINSTSTASVEGINTDFSASDVVQLWHEFERTRKVPLSVGHDAKPSTSMKAIETKELSFILTPPVSIDRGNEDESYLSSRRDADEVTVSVPFGVNFFHLTRTDVPKSHETVTEDTELSTGSPRTTFICVNHVSIRSLEVRCNAQEFIDLSGIVLISRRTIKAKIVKDAAPEGEGFTPQVRYSRIGRIATLRIGWENSALHSYACLGRVLSIFVLLSRILRLEAGVLVKLRRKRIEELSERLFSSSHEKLRDGEPQAVRNFFVQAIHYLRSSEEGTATTQRGAVVSEQLQIPSHVLSNLIRGKGSSSRYVDSIEASIRNFSLKAANHAIVDGDILQCKGGFRSNSGKANPHLEGYVLNAALGTILLSIRDDTAADALRMVSEVASFVRSAAFSIPTIRHDVATGEQKNVQSPDLLSNSYESPKFQRDKGSELLEAGLDPSTQTGQSNTGSSLGTINGRNGAYSRGRRVSWKSRSSLRRRRVRSSDETSKSELSKRYTWLRNPNPKPLTQPEQRLEGATAPLNDRMSLSTQITERPLKRKKSVSQAVAAGFAGLSSKETSLLTKTKVEDIEAPLRMHGANAWDDKDEKYERYTYVAVRTAGDSGPPRKKAKTMVRISTVVPPAFMSISTPASLRDAAPEFKSLAEHEASPSSFSGAQRESRSLHQQPNVLRTETALKLSNGEGPPSVNQIASDYKEDQKETPPSVTLFVSCHKIACHYFRGKGLRNSVVVPPHREADIRFLISEPRLTYMSSAQKGSHSVVVTSSCAELRSANDPNCILTGSIGKIGLTMSIVQGYVPLTLPKLIMSAQLSEFTTTLHATDLQSVLTFRESFKGDIKGILSAFVRTKQSISEMARATRLSSSRMAYPGRTVYSTLAFDLLCERSKIELEGFHPKDSEMKISYLLDGMFFSVVASEDDNAALTLGLRLYGHGLSLASPSWESIEKLRFPSLDARGVQWGEATGFPTILKVTAEPLMNSTSVQGLRHVLFTVAGLMAFQNMSPGAAESDPVPMSSIFFPPTLTTTPVRRDPSATQASGTPFTRSFAAWERTKGVRMDLSIRPMSLSLVSGQVLALFDVDTITGIFEWNKLVLVGVQLQMAVSVPRISLSFMRMPSSEFAIADIRPNEKRTSLSISLERSRIDLLKTQEDLTHTFTFRINVFAVSGQVRPWKLLLDAASWADEQEFVAELQAINYNSLSSGRQRQPRTATQSDVLDPMQHRVILIGANVQRFILAVPLLSTEEYSSSRLALRATELHCSSRRRLRGISPPTQNVMELKTHFIGILWENSPLLSTHHARIVFSVERPSFGSTAHFGTTYVLMYPGTWRICPRKDVIIAIIEAKNRKDNRKASERTRELLAALPEVTSYPASSTAGDSASHATEKQNRLLFESLSFKTLRTSGFIEGLDSTHSRGDPYEQSSKVNDQTQRVSKLSVPAFSISMVRRVDQRFDIVDVDFSGREGGEFPTGCLGKVSNLFTDLFGAVTAGQMNDLAKDEPEAQIQQTREMTRDVSVFIRFGKSLYRAQEEVNSSMEAKFGFFAGKSSSLLISLYTSTTLEDEGSHTTVMTGISPRLGLEITPLLSGAKVQSLRLTDARFLHGVSPSRPPHTLMHINRVTALMEAKTLLLTRKRLGSLPSVKSVSSDSGSMHKFSSSTSGRKVMFLFGKPRLQSKSFESGVSTDGKEYRVEPDIRLQMKFPANDDSPGDAVDLFVERCILGSSTDSARFAHHLHQLNAYAGFHKVILRAQWDLLGCKLQLREALFSYDVSNVLSGSNTVSLANIVNRLQFESMQYGRNTAKVDVDAVAAMWAVPTNELLIESTSVHAEVAYTLQNAKTKLSGQAKKLRNEVKLLTEKDLCREPRRGRALSNESNTLDSALNGQEVPLEIDRSPEGMGKTSGPKSSKSGGTVESEGAQVIKRQSRTIRLKGDELIVTMRGYQFDEARQSAKIALSRYDLRYRCGFANKNDGAFRRHLDIDFEETRLSYVDEDRGISSDLFRVPSPKLSLSIVENEDITNVDLQGVLLIALKHGFYYIQDFRNLAELTIMGIEHPLSTESTETSQKTETDREEDIKQFWNGKEAKVTVNLNPKIDVMGDLTKDMLHMNMISSRLGKAEAIPRQMFDFIIVPLEAFSKTLCGPLYK